MYTITCKQKHFIDKYTCYDTEATFNALKVVKHNGLLYCYVNKYNSINLAVEDIYNIRYTK